MQAEWGKLNVFRIEMPYIRCSPTGEKGKRGHRPETGGREYTSGTAKCPMREAGVAGD